MPTQLFESAIYGGLFGDPELAAILGDQNEIAQMLVFEAALAEVQGQLGMISNGPALAAVLRDLKLDPATLAEGTASAGVAVPALLAEVRRALPDDLVNGLHWGATSQDVIDTAHVLQYLACLDVLGLRLAALIDALEAASARHASVVMAGRTRGQIATPITFGLRLAQWAHPLIDAEVQLAGLHKHLGRIQFGGAAGTNAAVAPHGAAIAEGLAAALGLQNGPSWHTNRGGPLALAAWLAALAACLNRMGKDLFVLSRSEIAEAQAGTGGGSSTMPQKSNPVTAEAIMTLTTLVQGMQTTMAMAAAPGEERDGAAWAIEWAVLPQMLLATGAGLHHGLCIAETVTANPSAMTETLQQTPGAQAEAATFALAQYVPRTEAQRMVKQALSDPRPFAEALADLAPAGCDLAAALDPNTVIPAAEAVRVQIFARRSRAPD